LGDYSTVAGGHQNKTSAALAFAAGYKAKAEHVGAFVWADSTIYGTGFASTGKNQFLIRATGGVGIGTNNPGNNQVRVNSTTNGGIPTATLDVENFGTGNGIAAHFESNGTDATLVIDQDGSGDHIKTFANGALRFAVRDNGNVNADGTFSSPASDVAEWFEVDGGADRYEPGDVLAVSRVRDRSLEKSSEAYSSRVIGVYATKPGVLLGRSVEGFSVPVGVVGVLPTKVSGENGAIRRGDMLTSSSTPGYAMRAQPQIVGGFELFPTGSIIGKALENFEGVGFGMIEVMVMPR